MHDATTKGEPTRLMIVTRAFPRPNKSGVFWWAMEEAHALADRGFDVKVVVLVPWLPWFLGFLPKVRKWRACPRHHNWSGIRTSYPRYLYYSVPPLKSRQFKYPHLQNRIAWLSAKRQLSQYVQEFNPHVVYSIGLLPSSYIAQQIKRAFGIPYVLRVYGFYEITSCAQMPQRRQLCAQVFKDAADVLMVTSSMEKNARQIWSDVPIHTTYNGIKAPPPEMWQNPRPVELEGHTVVLCCGSMRPGKNIVLLVEAFGHVADRYPNAVLRIAGDGPEIVQVRGAIDRHGLANRVTLLGRVAHDRVMQEMLWCDLFALISTNEPFATVYLEAASAGKPIIYSQDGGITDVVQDNVHGCSVEPNSLESAIAALDRLLGDTTVRKKMGEAARALYEERLSSDAYSRDMSPILLRAAEHA